MTDVYAGKYVEDKLYEKYGVNSLLYFMVVNNARGCPININTSQLMPFVIANAHRISIKALGESARFLATQPTFTELMDKLHSIEAIATCVEYLSEEQLHLLNFDLF